MNFNKKVVTLKHHYFRMDMFKYCLTLILTATISLIAVAQSNVSDIIANGNQKIKDKDYKGAVDVFKSALSVSPTDSLALNGIIRANTLLEDYKEAQKWIATALEAYPNNPDFLFRRGIIQNLNGYHDKAILDFESALSQNPNSSLRVQILLNKASAHFKLEQFAESLADYNKVLELEPRNFNAYNFRGLVNFRLGYYIDAVTDYTTAIDLDPTSPLPYYNRGMSLIKLNETQKACADFRKACQMGYMTSCKMVVAECGAR